MLRTQRFIGSVTERDIGLLMLEELSVSPDFRAWLANLAFGSQLLAGHVGAWHSINVAALGESDLIYVFTTATAQQCALLIENKINAAAQPEQAHRYVLRGQKGVDDADWQAFRTCIVAPQRYLDSTRHSQPYDVAVSYEDLERFFLARSACDARASYKAQLLREAIEQNRRGYQAEVNAAMTEFVGHYCARAQTGFAQLAIQAAGPRPAGSTWIGFSPVGLRGMRVDHLMTTGTVRVLAPATGIPLEKLKARLGGDVTVALSGKWISLAMTVPALRPLDEPFEQALPKVETALATLQWLVVAVQAAYSELS